MDTCIACGNTTFELLVKSKDYCVSHEDFDINKCTSCGFAFTVNAPDEKNISRYYEHEDYISHSDTSEGLIFKVYHRVRNIMLKKKLAYITKHKKIKSLLDIGAGTAYFVNHLKKEGITAIGVEPDSGARGQAKQNFQIELLENLSQVDSLGKKYDAISMWHVLEHVHQLDYYFKKFDSFLEDKGVLAIAVPNYTSLDAKYYKKDWAAYDLPKHLWHFSPDSIKKLAEKHGFKHLKSYAMPYDSYYISLLSEKHKSSGFLGKIRAMLIGELSYLKAFFNSEKASSVVYIFQKN